MRHLCSQKEGCTVIANLVNKLTWGTRHLHSSITFFLPSTRTRVFLSVFGHSEIVVQ